MRRPLGTVTTLEPASRLMGGGPRRCAMSRHQHSVVRDGASPTNPLLLVSAPNTHVLSTPLSRTCADASLHPAAAIPLLLFLLLLSTLTV